MSKTTTLTPVNGSGASDDRPCGVASLRDREVKALISLVCDALSETREVSHRMHTVIYRDDARANAVGLYGQFREAVVCLQATDHYLHMLRDVIAELSNGSVDPWAEPAF